MCAIIGVYRRPWVGNETVLPLVRRMLYAQSNRGRDGWGESSLNINNGSFRIRLSQTRADIDPVLIYARQGADPQFDSSTIIGHVRWATSGVIGEKNSQPVQNDPEGKLLPRLRLTMAFNGNIANVDELRAELEREGVALNGSNDTEVLLRLIASIIKRETNNGQNVADYEKIFREVERRIDGGCSLVMLDGEGNMVLYRNSPGIRPLEFMETNDGLLLAASETCAFEGIQGTQRTVPPGEIVWYDRKHDHYEFRYVGQAQLANCAKECTCIQRLDVMEPLYFQEVTSRLFLQSNRITRRNIGRIMADTIAPMIESIPTGDRHRIRIMPVPNTGIPYAEGLVEELSNRGLIPANANVQGIEARIKGRAFQADDESRVDFLKRKYWVIEDIVKDNIIFSFDDTAIRADASKVILKKLRDAGAAEAHWIVGSPPVVGSDYYGINTPLLEGLAFWQIWGQSTLAERGQLYRQQDNNPAIIDLGMFQEKMAQFVGADSITYLPLPILKTVLPGNADNYNYSCFTGSYPTRAGQRLFDANFEQLAA